MSFELVFTDTEASAVRSRAQARDPLPGLRLEGLRLETGRPSAANAARSNARTGGGWSNWFSRTRTAPTGHYDESEALLPHGGAHGIHRGRRDTMTCIIVTVALIMIMCINVGVLGFWYILQVEVQTERGVDAGRVQCNRAGDKHFGERELCRKI